jgi:dTDP-4-amino-4,6-dideoxygalactose transaminase
MATGKPALLGGRPIFDKKVNIVQPHLPSFETMAQDTQQIIESGMLTKGRYLQRFEKLVADHLNVKYAIGVSSCTTGLMLTYQTLRPMNEVIVPSFTFMATISALVWAGLRPVFADVDFRTTNLDPKQVEAAIGPETSAIVGVHNFGNPADIDDLQALADRYGLKLIFDAAHGFGALYQGASVGAQGDAQVYSLSPTKLLIAGEGGVVATNDDDLAERIRIGREYGNDGKYNSAFAGMNARLGEFNALMGLHSLSMLEGAASHRNKVAATYHDLLGQIPGIGFQEIRSGNRSSYKDFSITIDSKRFGLTRDALAYTLAAEGVDTRAYYNPPVHLHTAYCQHYNQRTQLPNTLALAERSLSLPIWSHMKDEIVQGICEAIQRIYEYADGIRSVIANRAPA